jgi:hypothetical protein
MSEGPTRREIERVREALDRHDAELREDAEPATEEPDEDPEDEEEGV